MNAPHHTADDEVFDQLLRLATGLVVGIWSFRRELAPLVLGGVAAGLTTHLLSNALPAELRSLVPLAVATTIAILVGRRYWQPEPLAAGRAERGRWVVRLRWSDAARAAGLLTPDGRPARLGRLRTDGTAITAPLRLPPGLSLLDVERGAPRLATALHARAVAVTPDHADASRCQLRIRLGDVLGEVLRWQPTDVVAGMVAIGCDEDGRSAAVPLLGHSLLVGGIPGSGKSGVLQAVVAAVARTPGWQLAICDPKRVELSRWRHHVDHYACNAADALALLDDLLVEMDVRYRHMEARGLRSADPTDPATRPLVLVIDELAAYTGAADRKTATAFETRLRDYLSRGRAAGMSAVLATQKPTSDVVPTSVRDVISSRLAMACTTPQQSDAILGSSWAAQGSDASRLPSGRPGTGLLLTDDATPRRIRAWHLDDAVLDTATTAGARP